MRPTMSPARLKRRDGFGELLSGPGPGRTFAAHLHGFDADGAVARPIGRIDGVVLGSRFGATVAAGDVDDDGFAEIACGAGPDLAFASLLRSFDFDGARLLEIPSLSRAAYGLTHGVRVGVADLGL